MEYFEIIIKWDKIPKGYDFVAIDADGKMYAYKERPEYSNYHWVLLGDNCIQRGYRLLCTVSKPDDFTQCLYQRPKENKNVTTIDTDNMDTVEVSFKGEANSASFTQPHTREHYKINQKQGIDWRKIDKRIRFVAMFENSNIFKYTIEPTPGYFDTLISNGFKIYQRPTNEK